MTKLARFVTRQSTAILLLTALVCLAGAYAGWTMPTSVFPHVQRLAGADSQPNAKGLGNGHLPFFRHGRFHTFMV